MEISRRPRRLRQQPLPARRVMGRPVQGLLVSARRAGGKMQRTKRMTALIQSCAKWRMPHKISIGPASCPLCVLYFNKPNCKGCHVRKATGYQRCIGTPYPEYAKSLYNGRSDDSLRLKEYQFLRGLWKKEKAKCQTSN